MKIDDLTIGELKQLKSLLNGDQCDCTPDIADGGVRIVILQRGWVMVGRYSRYGSRCRLEHAAVIRCWGTTKGIGEIASGGPVKDKTILDECPDVEFHELTVVAEVLCEQKNWSGR